MNTLFPDVEIQVRSERWNQTGLHQELAARALVWLAARASFSGCRGTTEFKVADGYSADAFGLAMHQIGFWQDMRMREGQAIVPQQIASHIFEVKVSRADFLSTFKSPEGKHANRHRPVANLHYCVTPKGLVLAIELPPFWGLLEASGRGLKVARHPLFEAQPEAVNHGFGYDLLWCDWTHGRLSHQQIRSCPHCLEVSQRTVKDDEPLCSR